jgi:hypothetical protein
MGIRASRREERGPFSHASSIAELAWSIYYHGEPIQFLLHLCDALGLLFEAVGETTYSASMPLR